MKIPEKELKVIEKLIGFSFINKELLIEALTHKSYLNENRSISSKNNERLEFLGDAVLELSVTRYLFVIYPEFMEGDLTSFRAALVKTESLAEEAFRLRLGDFIFMSKGEESTGGRTRQYILANTVEAIIGAIYLDQGYELADKFILEHICYKAEKIISERSDIDSKSKLQEIVQEKLRITPTYELISAIGPDHNKIFEMGVYTGDNLITTGKGKSKQEAEQDAAKKALLIIEPDFVNMHSKQI